MSDLIFGGALLVGALWVLVPYAFAEAAAWNRRRLARKRWEADMAEVPGLADFQVWEAEMKGARW